ncbi:MAG: glycosyltransferase family 4 protein [Planctomycetota bacterium]|jgi:glycosyltransferase involved in cell wall biosynthesis
MKHLCLGIDASNIISGGGLTHLQMLLEHSNPEDFGFTKVIIWSNQETLDKLPNREWLMKVNPPILNHSMPFRFFWQQFILPFCIKELDCDMLFSPGGTLPLYVPVKSVAIQQNLLIFEKEEADRYDPASLMRLRIKFLNFMQKMSLQKANGVIFLTQYAKKTIISQLSKFSARSRIIAHGIEKRFFADSPKVSHEMDKKKIKLLYVSTVDVYKHHNEVAAAVDKLIHDDINLEIDFIGGAYQPSLESFNRKLDKYDFGRKHMRYHGALPFEELHKMYKDADIFVFASSCENLPIILLEAMAAGMPIACSKKGPMPEVLQDCGFYFDCENHNSIAESIKYIVDNPVEAEFKCKKSMQLAAEYKWEKCAKETLEFLEECF